MRALALLTALSACGRIGFDLGPAGTDADMGTTDADVPVLDAEVEPLGEFGAAVRVDALSHPDFDDDPTATGDLLEMFFSSRRPGGTASDNIWTSRRLGATDTWSTPILVAELSSGTQDESPGVTADGLTIYLGSARQGGFNIFVATRSDREPTTPWSSPVLVDELSSGGSDFQAQPDSSDLRLVMYRLAAGQRDVYLSTRVASTDTWSSPQPITEVNSPMGERSPCLTLGGREIYFGSDRSSDSANVHDIFFAARASTDIPFGVPSAVSTVSSTSNDDDPWLSPDGRLMLFSSNRSGNSEIYEARR